MYIVKSGKVQISEKVNDKETILEAFTNKDFLKKNYLIPVFKNNFLHSRKNKNIFEIQC